MPVVPSNEGRDKLKNAFEFYTGQHCAASWHMTKKSGSLVRPHATNTIVWVVIDQQK